MSINGQPNVAELDTFLPQDGSKKDGQYGKYKVSVSPTKKLDADAEALQDGKSYFDPFKGRHNLPNSTTDCDTLTHLLKASLGSGILAMPIAFRDCGIVAGIFATILVSLVCTHCAYILVKCAHELYYKTRVTSMSFADVGEIAFANGPPWARRFSGLARVSIIGGLFAAYFGTCSVYTVIIATNFQQVIEFYTGDDEATSGERIRLYIAALMIPLVLISWVPNLKKLAPISMVANAFMGVGLLITFYYLSIDLPSVAERAYVAPFEVMPQFFSITIFAMEAIGVVMPLENAMKTPQHFIGICGVLNQGMGGVTMIYIFLGFLGYLKYGADTKGSITLNLPTEDYAAQAVKILVGLAVFCTYGLQYFVCLEIVWNSVKDRFQKNSALAEYVVRTILTVAAVILAVAVPTIGPFLGLIGALCFSLLGLIIPVFIEFVTFWDKGFGPCNWIVWKNILVLICGFLALVFGSYTSFLEIINVKHPLPPLETFRNESFLLGNETMANLNATLQQLSDVLNSTIEAMDKLTYKVPVYKVPKKLDAHAEILQDGKSYFDPFKERHNLPNSTTDCDTLTHLLKASVGSGILAMPIAFRDCGIIAGIFATILVSLVCTHGAYILVKSAHELYYKTRVTSLSFADVGEIAFANGPPWARRFSGLARVSIISVLFAAYFSTCSVYTVIIATNFQQVIEFYTGDDEATSGERIRLYIAALMIPLILISWVPNLKKLAPISLVANAFMSVGLLITFYYLSMDLPSMAERPYVAPFEVMPQYFSITIFAMEAIGVVMPLENAMKTPRHLIGICGVLHQGMAGVGMIYLFVGFLGYWKYGSDTKGSITLNLPTEEYAAQAVKILVGLAVFCTYGLQFFVCLEIVWNSVKDRFQKNSALAEYVVRTILTVAAVMLAVAVPTIGPFIGLIGALCFSVLGLIIPVFIEFVTIWDKGFGPCNWIVWKNIFVLLFGFFALIFGSYTNFLEIINAKDPLPPLETFRNESILLGNETMANLNAPWQQLGDVLNSTIEAMDKLT